MDNWEDARSRESRLNQSVINLPMKKWQIIFDTQNVFSSQGWSIKTA